MATASKYWHGLCRSTAPVLNWAGVQALPGSAGSALEDVRDPRLWQAIVDHGRPSLWYRTSTELAGVSALLDWEDALSGKATEAVCGIHDGDHLDGTTLVLNWDGVAALLNEVETLSGETTKRVRGVHDDEPTSRYHTSTELDRCC